MRNSRPGFTIVELLIVIVVIGILASITVVAFNGMRARADDSELAHKQSSVYRSLLNFYTINGYYPCTNDFTATNLEVPASTLLFGKTGNAAFNYVTWPNTDGSGFGQSTGQCKSFALSYTSQSSGQVMIIRNPGHRGY